MPIEAPGVPFAIHADLDPVLRERDRRRKAAELQRLAQQFRIEVLDILHTRGTGHWGGASSAAELLAALYFDVLRIRPDEPQWPERDRLVLSKGHASCMLYTVLAHRGFLPVDELPTFRQLDSRLQGHPCMRRTPGVDMSTGSLGHGLSIALGMALAARRSGKDWWTYALIGDGDLNEGQTWEAIMAGAKFRPERLVALVDYNKVQLDGPSGEIMPMDPLPDKLRAFRWNVAPVVYNGHSLAEIFDSFDWIRGQREWPAAVIYSTHKGRGVSFMEDNAYWHGAPIDDASYVKARAELIATWEELGEKAMTVSGGVAMREAFGQALVELAGRFPEMMVLDADVSTSTRTALFAKKYPERFFNLGVAEANMVDIAAGMAACGLRPVAATFALFMSLKGGEQIRQSICYNNLPVVLAGSYAGLSDSFDGASHQSILDLAVMRAMPNLAVVVPADEFEVRQALEAALVRNGPTYIRICRNPVPALFAGAAPLEIGRVRHLREGTDLSIAVCGVPTSMVLEAAERLAADGIQADVLEVSSIKPVDEAALADSVRKTGCMLTVEEHSVIGGLGGAVAEVLGRLAPAPMDSIGVPDRFPESGPYPELLRKFGISAAEIETRARRLVERRAP